MTLKENPAALDVKLLERYEEFWAFLNKQRSVNGEIEGDGTSLDKVITPEEQIAAAYEALNEALRTALLAKIAEAKPVFFEKLIIDLLVEMGYGGGREEAGKHLGQTGDGGVDGVIFMDQLGLDRVYIQAKRYKQGNSINGAVVQAFIGALMNKGASKGVFVTTSAFTPAAKQAAQQAGSARVVLIDGDTLADHMIRLGVGVREMQKLQIMKVDTDYFEEDEAL